jgi:DNA-binding transcriptional LysR family regulator
MMLNYAQLSRIDLNLLVLLHAVLAEGHVARAADRLNLTPSAVSHSLRRLRRLLNDPLFLRTPKGVVPTARAVELGGPVAEILARIDGVLASATPFDPATASRRFVIGAPDAVLASAMLPLLEHIGRRAPQVSISLIHLMPARRAAALDQPWRDSLVKLEKRDLDVALLPVRAVPPRFEARRLYEEDFVVAMRKGHMFARTPTLAAFCRAQHLLASLEGDPYGFVDEVLAERGLERRVALTVPSFAMALAHLTSSDLIAALPRRLVARHAARFGLVSAELPFARKPDPIQAVATRAAMMDAAIAWLVEAIAATMGPGQPSATAPRRKLRPQGPG